MCATSLVAMAQYGWYYNDDQAILMSDSEYLEGDFDDPTRLGIVVGGNNVDYVAMGIHGTGLTDFRDSQLYVVVSFDFGKSERWRIKELKTDKSQFKFFVIVSTEKFINRLRKCEHVSVTLPIYKYGKQTFYLNANGYPLDW